MVRQLDRLERLADLGMQVAETLAAQEIPDALAFDRAARAVRLTGALQSLLIAQIDARDQGREIAGPSGARTEPLESGDNDDEIDEDERAWLINHGLIEPDPTDSIPARPSAPYDRPDRERPDRETYADLLKRPVAEIIAHICHDLGLDPEAVRAELALPTPPSPGAVLSDPDPSPD
jgi:hypothetical protein